MVAVRTGGVDVGEDAGVGVGFDGGERKACGRTGHVECIVGGGWWGVGCVEGVFVGDLVED